LVRRAGISRIARPQRGCAILHARFAVPTRAPRRVNRKDRTKLAPVAPLIDATTGVVRNAPFNWGRLPAMPAQSAAAVASSERPSPPRGISLLGRSIPLRWLGLVAIAGRPTLAETRRSDFLESFRPPRSTILRTSARQSRALPRCALCNDSCLVVLTRSPRCVRSCLTRRRCTTPARTERPTCRVPGVFDEVPPAARTKSSPKGGREDFPRVLALATPDDTFVSTTFHTAFRTADVFARAELVSPDSRSSGMEDVPSPLVTTNR